MTKFKAGFSGNPSGRKPGAKGRIHKDIKLSFQLLIQNNLPNMETWLNDIAEKDKAKALELLLKLTEFILPKMKSVEAYLELEKLSDEQITDLAENILKSLENDKNLKSN